MSKILFPVSILFQAVSLTGCMVHNNLSSVLTFLVATALVGFIAFSEKRELTEADQIREDIRLLKSRMDGVAISKGFGR